MSSNKKNYAQHPMKKKRISRKRNTLKARWTEKRAALKEKNFNLAHPVVRASYIWSIISDQLCDILGPEVHHQWFKNVKPTVISHNVLLLEVPNHFYAQWIHTHYHELVDVLLSVLDGKLSSFFVSQSERTTTQASGTKILSESSASEINSQTEYDEGRD